MVPKEDEILTPPPPAIAPMAVVRRRWPLYASLLALGVLPALDIAGLTGDAASLNVVRTGFFAVTALTTAYLGAERQDIGTTAPVTGKSAALAPVFAATTLGLLYALIKYTNLDPGQLYRLFAVIFGWLCLTELLQPLVALSPLGEALADAGVGAADENSVGDRDEIAKEAAKEAKREAQRREMMAGLDTIGESTADAARFRAGFAPASAAALAAAVGYVVTVGNIGSGAGGADGFFFIGVVENLRLTAFFNDYLAVAIAMVSLGQVALESFLAGASLLGGLFLYDALSVFKSDAMVTVATKIEAPVKLLFAGASAPTDGRYPFAVLGLGDIAVPGAFLAMLRQFDIEQWYKSGGSGGAKAAAAAAAAMEPLEGASLDFYADMETPYFSSGLLAYSIGIAATFGVLATTGQGQPALFYIVPSLLAASLATAASRGELPELLAFKSARAAAGTKAREEAKEARRREKEEGKS